MSQTRDQQKTSTVGAQMSDGSNAGQELVSAGQQNMPRRETAVERAKREAKERRGQIIDAITSKRTEYEKLLNTFGITFDFFMAGLTIGLAKVKKADRDFFDAHKGASISSVLESALWFARMGLIADGKEGALVRYANTCQPMPMVQGFVKIINATGYVRDINHDVVIKGDTFEFSLGDDGFIRHRPELTRDIDGEAVGAWCIVTTTNGGRYVEVTGQKDLQKMAAASRATRGPRKEWASEMHRKGPFRRLVKRLPQDNRLAMLLEADDRTMTTTPIAGGDREHERAHKAAGMSNEELLGGPSPRPPPEEEPDDDDEDGAEFEDAAEDEAEVSDEDPEVVASVMAAIGAVTETEELDEVMNGIVHGPHMATFGAETKAAIIEAESRTRGRLLGGGIDVAVENPQLRALTSKSQTEPRIYDDPQKWSFDLLNVMSSIGKDKARLKTFWDRNAAFVVEAGHIPEAAAHVARVLMIAHQKGLSENA